MKKIRLCQLKNISIFLQLGLERKMIHPNEITAKSSKSFQETSAVRKMMSGDKSSLTFCDEEMSASSSAALPAEDPTWAGSSSPQENQEFSKTQLANYLKGKLCFGFGTFLSIL